jgi:hypothetical protein
MLREIAEEGVVTAADPSAGERATSKDAPLPPGHGQSFETVESEWSTQLD